MSACQRVGGSASWRRIAGSLVIGWLLAGCAMFPVPSALPPSTPLPARTPPPTLTITPIPSGTPTPTMTAAPAMLTDDSSLHELDAALQAQYAEPMGFTSLAYIRGFVSRTYARSDLFPALIEALDPLLDAYSCDDAAACLTRAYQNLPAGPALRRDLPEPGEPDSDLVLLAETEIESQLAGHYYHRQWVLNTDHGPIIHVIQDDNTGYDLPTEEGPDRYIPRIRRFLIEPLALALWDATRQLQESGVFQHGEVLAVNGLYRDQIDSDWLAYHFYGVDARPGGLSQHNEGFAVDLRILTPALRQFRSLTDSDVERLAPILNAHGFFWGEGFTDDRPHVVYLGILDEQGALLVDGPLVIGALEAAGFDLRAIQAGEVEGLRAREFYEMVRLAVSRFFYREAVSLTRR